MAQSNSYNITTSRDGIIARALRLIGAIGQGETPSSQAVTEAAEALNDLVKEWAADGMPLWAMKSTSFSVTASTASYTIGVGSTINANAPLRIIRAFSRLTASTLDSPLTIISQDDYDMISNKSATGSPSQLMYVPPRGISGTENQGTIYLYVAPDASFASGNTIHIYAHYPFMDFDAAADVPDFPQYWYNALKWGLADQLSYEYGVGLAQRSMLTKKALFHKEMALSYGTEEGSFKIQPMPWD